MLSLSLSSFLKLFVWATVVVVAIAARTKEELKRTTTEPGRNKTEPRSLCRRHDDDVVIV